MDPMGYGAPLSRYGGQKILTSCILESQKNGGTVEKIGQNGLRGKRFGWKMEMDSEVPQSGADEVPSLACHPLG